MTSYLSNIEMNNIDDGKIKGYLASSSNSSSRDSLVLSNASSRLYHKRIKINNKLPEVNSIDLINSSQLSYAGTVKVGGSVSLATDKEVASNS